MKFYMPTTLYQEKDCVKNHAHELAALGSRALLLTGRYSAKANGSFDDVSSALSSQGVRYCLIDDIEENPSIETVMRARDFCVAKGADFVIGIGGGSPMDAAKAVALMAANPDRGRDFLFTPADHPACLPVAAVPTTCGTGSEVTGVSVLTNHQKQTKGSIIHRIYPDLALVDSRYLRTAPMHLIADTAADSFCHLAESYLHVAATDYSRMFVREGLSVWRRCKDALLRGSEGDKSLTPESFGFSDAEYDNLMLSSTWAGMAIAHTGTSIPHGLSYYLTYHFAVPHGRACAYFIGGYIAEAPKAEREALLSWSGFSCVRELEEYLARICRMQPIPKEARRAAADQVMQNPKKLSSCPYPVDEEALFRIAGADRG